ncbi:MAG: hypothetical protein ABSF14_01220 [Terriglobia bacterium]
MSPNPELRRMGRTFLLLFLIVSVTSAAAAQFAKKSARRRGEKPDTTDLEDILKPQLLNADSNPTLRYPIISTPGSVFSITYGWLDITRNTVRYQVAQPLSKSEHSFEVSRSEIRDLKFAYNYIIFRSPKKRQMIFYLPQDRWGSVHTGPGVGAAAGRETEGTVSIYQAMRNFDRLLALVKPPPPAPPPVAAQTLVTPPPEEPKPAAPPAPPAIVLAAPPGAGANQVIELDESPLVIRGVAMDSTSIPVVTINGSSANMRPRGTQAAEFWSDPLPLQPGGNRVQITASNSAHAEAKLVFIVHYTPKVAPPNPRALGRQEIISLLQGGVPNARIVEIIKDRGIKFTPTADDLNDIRAEGGDDRLIQALQQAAAHP